MARNLLILVLPRQGRRISSARRPCPRQRRQTFEKDPAQVLAILKDGTARANQLAEETLYLAKQAIKQDYFPRTLAFQ